MRAALYARVSTEEQTEGYSIDAQRRAFHDYVQGKGWVAAAEYIDEGKSARSEDLKNRPRFKAMMQAAKEREFDVLVVHKLDRFARNLIVTLQSFEELSKSGIAFVSLTEQIDYTTPMGKVFLAMAGAFAQFYSDNLSQETKKGWHERRKQGLYCGALPFGTAKGEDGIPVPDVRERKTHVDGQELAFRNYEGLKMAFELSAQGKSDRQTAVALNRYGYRTTGTHGPRPFSKDTVGGMLANRFYVGYVPDGNGGWLKAKHEPFVSPELFEAVQSMRVKNQKSTHQYAPHTKTVYSLTGITYCWHCREQGQKGRIHISCVTGGKPRLGCYNRAKGWGCPQKSTFLDVYEHQIRAYLDAFSIPEDYRQRILEMHSKLNESYDTEKERRQLEATLSRLKDLYKWGDIGKNEYQKEKQRIEGELTKLTPFEQSANTTNRLAEFLENIAKAWDVATHEQRNKLARTLFQEIWLKDDQVVAVKPQPEFEPFFKLNWEQFSAMMKSKPRAPSGSHAISFE